jgi:hypothetical protein
MKDRGTPTDHSVNRFELPVRAVRTALETIDHLGPASTAEEIFRASTRLSAATGFLARELFQADQAARLRQGLPVGSPGEVRLLREEAARHESAPSPSSQEPPEPVS